MSGVRRPNIFQIVDTQLGRATLRNLENFPFLPKLLQRRTGHRRILARPFTPFSAFEPAWTFLGYFVLEP